MAPVKHPEWPDVPDNREDFMRDIIYFYTQRGVPFEPNPKVALTKIDIWELFNLVQARGGYDSLSAEKLAWRRLAEGRWNLGGPNGAAYAFQLKTVYYKNLSAYWLARVHKQEPPPREILEDRTAKGANLIERTVDNYDTSAKTSTPAQPKRPAESDGEKMDIDDPNGSAARGTRLRQAPPQRQFFQPDISSSRQSRQPLPHAQSPQPPALPPHYPTPQAPAANLNSASFNISTWDGRPIPTAHMIPVTTSSSNPSAFQEKVRKLRENQLAKLGLLSDRRRGMPPGTGFPGPNIYMRTTLALKSGIPAEQDYALHHLLKMSHERGDKFRFEDFPGLSDGLINKALEISSLFYDVSWSVNYEDLAGDPPLMTLDGCKGTSNLLHQISHLTPRYQGEEVTTAEFQHKLSKCIEAAMILRNFSLLDANSVYLSKQMHMRDLLVIWLNLPRQQCLIELIQYGMEMAEQLAAYWIMEDEDPLYISLQRCLISAFERQDKGCGECALRALSSIGMRLETANPLRIISMSIIRPLLEWILVDDEDLLGACFDFLYQFTSVPDNMAMLLERMHAHEVDLHALVRRLAQCLFLGAREYKFHLGGFATPPKGGAKSLAPIPKDIMDEIRNMTEPKRSTIWLKTLFQEDSNSDITQIELWNAYQGSFTAANSQVPLLAAADFIKNVSTTYPEAKAEVVQAPPPPPRFIIKGIKYRHVPVYFDGKDELLYLRCLWESGKVEFVERDADEMNGTTAAKAVCGTFHRDANKMFEHIMQDHLGFVRNEEGQWDFSVEPSEQDNDATAKSVARCGWSTCTRKSTQGGSTGLMEIAWHLRTHLPDTTNLAAHRAKYNKTRDDRNTDEPWTITYRDTTTTPDGHPTGLPFTAMLLLRMMARNVPKAANILEGKGSPAALGGQRDWMQLLFFMVREDLFRVAAYNRSLSDYVWDVVSMIDHSIAD